MQSISTNKNLTNNERQQLYADLYNLADLGFSVFVAYFHVRLLNKALSEQLERLYALLWGKYIAITETYPDDKNRAIVFENYDNLPGIRWEVAQDWLLGKPNDDLSPNYYMIGAEDFHNNALGHIKNQYYLAGGKTITSATSTEVQGLCNEARDILKLARSAQVLKDNCIQEYTFEWDDVSFDVIINDTYRLTTTKDGSASTKIMTEVMKHSQDGGRTAFTVDIGAGSRPLSQIMNSDLHIDPLLRKIFFRGSGANQLRFRSPVSKQQLISENVDTSDLDIQLVASGAKVIPKSKIK